MIATHRLQWTALVVIAVVGGSGYLAFAGPRAGLSFVAGIVVAGLAFSGGIAAITWAGSVTPALSLVVALMTYTMIVVILAAILAGSDPDVLDGPAFALGLALSAVVWALAQLRVTRPGDGS